MRSQSPEEPASAESRVKRVGDLAVPTGMESIRVESVAVIGGLRGTGSDPGPSPQRAALMDEMQKRGVEKPNRVLASGNVSLVLVRTWIRPGIQKGDRIDVEVRTPSHSETTSLRGGYLLETRLKELAVLGGQIHGGKELAVAEGPVLIDPSAGPNDKVLLCRGRVLGGAVSQQSRPIGLVLTPGHQSVLNSSRVATAVNRRFYTFHNGLKTGMAKAKTDEYIELDVHPRYQNNIQRYIQVVRALPIHESANLRMQRVAELKEDAEGSGDRRRRGHPARSARQRGNGRFAGGDPLAESRDAVLCRGGAGLPRSPRGGRAVGRDRPQPTRLPRLRADALSVITDYIAYEKLVELLSAPSAETRYGAFRALWTMNDQDPLVKGELIGDQFHYHVLNVAGPPMIHVTRNRLPEIVVFGPQQRLLTPLAVNAGNEIMITSHGGDEISVSKFTVRDGDQKRIVSTRVDDVIRAVVELGGTYPDVVQFLQEAKNCDSLTSRFEVDALPEAGRTFNRKDDVAGSDQDKPVAGPTRQSGDDKANLNARTTTLPKIPRNRTNPDGNAKTKKGFFAKILGR